MTVVGPFITTASVVNPLFQRGAHLRRNMLADIYNSIIMAWRVGVRFDGSGVGNAMAADSIQLRNIIFAGNLKLTDSTGTGSLTPTAWLQTSSFENTIFSNNTQVQLTSPFNIYPDVPLPATNVNNWIPLTGSPALSGSNFNNPNLAGFENVSFRGAFGSFNWTSNWTQFNPKNYNIIGIHQISNTVPDKFLLEQNYPNPFNPSTKIKFSVVSNGNSSNVNLKVYDASGKEVAELVNQKLSAGTYEAEFNAANFSSGVYFYKLIAGNTVVDSKRMLLVK